MLPRLPFTDKSFGTTSRPLSDVPPCRQVAFAVAYISEIMAIDLYRAIGIGAFRLKDCYWRWKEIRRTEGSEVAVESGGNQLDGTVYSADHVA